MISEPSLEVEAPQVPQQLRLEMMVQLKHTTEKPQVGDRKTPGTVFGHFPMGQVRT